MFRLITIHQATQRSPEKVDRGFIFMLLQGEDAIGAGTDGEIDQDVYDLRFIIYRSVVGRPENLANNSQLRRLETEQGGPECSPEDNEQTRKIEIEIEVAV